MLNRKRLKHAKSVQVTTNECSITRFNIESKRIPLDYYPETLATSGETRPETQKINTHANALTGTILNSLVRRYTSPAGTRIDSPPTQSSVARSSA